LPWTDEKARFTALFERLAIDVLRICDVKGATAILRISWDEVWHIMERATVDYIGDDRKQASLDGYFVRFSEKKREKIKAIAMDVWDPYLAWSR
jgi:transposase